MSKPKSKAGEAANSRQQLLKAAAQQFAKYGLEGASVRDIAQEAGTNVCMISYHFGGKENLYRECLKEFGESRVELTRGILEAPASLAEFKVRLKLFIKTLVDVNADRPEFSRIICKEIEAGMPAAQDIFEATFLQAIRGVIQFFKSAQKAGLIKKDLDPLFMANIMYGSVVHQVRFDLVGKKYFNYSISETANREKLVDTLVETLLSGMIETKA